MSSSKHIVKRHGHTEEYDQRKLYASIYAACLAVRATTGEAELVAEKVTEEIQDWLGKKHEITAYDIRQHASKHLKVYNQDAAYMYHNHREIHR